MARSLLAPTAFLTLLGLAPGCFRAADSPVVAAMAGATAADLAVVETAAPAAPAELVAYATTRSGNARAPSYDDAMIEMKAPDNFVDVEGVGPQDAPQAVVLGLEAAPELVAVTTP
ncbi:MAG: hypothetical protein V4850_22960 [Myxococcota bacterium]